MIFLLVLWQVLTRAFDVPKFLLPAPTDVAALMVEEWPLIQMHSLATIGSIVSGYVAAVLFALTISALMIRFPLVERLIMPIFVGLQSVPKIAIAPLILVWVGAGIGSKILVVASIAFFPMVINTMAGFKEVDRGLADVFRSVDANERQMFFRLRLPYAMPYIFAGLRIATTLSVLGAIVAEWLAASNGLGYLVLSGSFNFNTARSFAAIIALAVIGTAFFGLMSWVERMISWKREGSDRRRNCAGVTRESLMEVLTMTKATVLGALALALLGASAAHAQDKVMMRINFTPWGMHAQYFGGVAQGIYKAEGIDLEIRPPSAGQQNEVFIGTGREQFGVANADSFIKARASGVPVVAVMADEPDTPFSVITLKKDNYTDPKPAQGQEDLLVPDQREGPARAAADQGRAHPQRHRIRQRGARRRGADARRRPGRRGVRLSLRPGAHPRHARLSDQRDAAEGLRRVSSTAP